MRAKKIGSRTTVTRPAVAEFMNVIANACRNTTAANAPKRVHESYRLPFTDRQAAWDRESFVNDFTAYHP